MFPLPVRPYRGLLPLWLVLPLVFSGWDQQTGPKPTMQAVPAGSVYVFQCADEAEARELAGSLSWPNRRSTRFGEKGFGVGVCSFIKPSNE